MWNPRLLTLSGLIIAAAVLRLAPLPPNFAPIGAMALFGGALMTQRHLAMAIPLIAMLVSDLILAAVWYGTAVFWSMPFVYAAFLIYVELGRLVRSRLTPLRIGTAATTGAILFFILTNFGVWIRSPLYPLSWEGLIACYTAAIPYFRNTLAADVLFASLLFGAFFIAQHRWVALREPQPQPSLTAHG